MSQIDFHTSSKNIKGNICSGYRSPRSARTITAPRKLRTTPCAGPSSPW